MYFADAQKANKEAAPALEKSFRKKKQHAVKEQDFLQGLWCQHLLPHCFQLEASRVLADVMVLWVNPRSGRSSCLCRKLWVEVCR